jgi:hypothetical protein
VAKKVIVAAAVGVVLLIAVNVGGAGWGTKGAGEMLWVWGARQVMQKSHKGLGTLGHSNSTPTARTSTSFRTSKPTPVMSGSASVLPVTPSQPLSPEETKIVLSFVWLHEIQSTEFHFLWR